MFEDQRWQSVLAALFLASGLAATAARAEPPAEKRLAPAAVRDELEELGEEEERLGNDEPAAAAEFLRQRRAPTGERDVPVERYLVALRRMAAMPRYSTATQTVLPPRSVAAGQGTSSLAEASALGRWTALGPGNFGGRTRAFVIHPGNPRIMYAAGVAGGVWKTTDSGASWTPLADLLANIAVTTLAMAPGNPNVLYAGTGEGYFNGDAMRGAGIFKTVDGGAHWTHLASTAGPDFYAVNKIVISPLRPARMYAATGTGVWRSLDSGANWGRVLDPNVFGGCLDLALRIVKKADVVFASCGIFVQATVYRNDAAHAGGSWNPVLSDPGMGRTSLAIAPSNQNVIYALASTNVAGDLEDGLHAVFRSANGGSTWTAQIRNTTPNKLEKVLLSNPIAAFSQECFGVENVFVNQGWYDNVIAVDPRDPNRVWAGGVDLFRSDDGGKTWGLTSYGWAKPPASAFKPSYAHVDQHAIVFHPGYNGRTNKIMFVGNDGGVFKTHDARAATVKTAAGVCDPTASPFVWESLNHGYGVTQFYHGLPYPDGTAYLGGTQDNGTLRGNDAAGIDGWVRILTSDGGFVAINPEAPWIIYAETIRLSLRKSTDGGQTFVLKTSGITESRSNFLFITPYVMDPSNPDRLWIGGSRLWRTDNAAETWTSASLVVASDFTPVVSALAVAPSDSNRVLAGTIEGFIHRSQAALTATGDTGWPQSRPRTGWVSWLAHDPEDPAITYATYSTFGGGAHVWKSTNGGASWEPLDGTGAGALPDIPVNTIVVNPSNRSHLYIGTDVGVFSSLDGGQTWMVENTGFANVPVFSLAFQGGEGARNLYAFTHGRGVWRVPLP